MEKRSSDDIKIPKEPRKDQMIISKKFAENLGNPKKMFYPACGTDITPTKAFPEADITYLDVPGPVIEAVRDVVGKTSTVIASKAEDYNAPEEFDLVLSVHSHAPHEHEVKDLKKGGRLLIANKCSDPAFENKDLKLVGVFHEKNDENGSVTDVNIKTEKLRKYKKIDPKKQSPFVNSRKHYANYYLFQKKNPWFQALKEKFLNFWKKEERGE
jgi:hypothetical protein